MSILKEISDYITDVLDNNPERQEITICLSRAKAETLLKEIASEEKGASDKEYRKEFDKAMETLCKVAGVSPSDVMHKRNYPYNYYRGIISSYLRTRRATLSQIGRLFDRDHSSISCCLKILEENSGNPTLRDIYEIMDAFNEKIKSY